MISSFTPFLLPYVQIFSGAILDSVFLYSILMDDSEGLGP